LPREPPRDAGGARRQDRAGRAEELPDSERRYDRDVAVVIRSAGKFGVIWVS
jgi:hypothetical protein